MPITFTQWVEANKEKCVIKCNAGCVFKPNQIRLIPFHNEFNRFLGNILFVSSDGYFQRQTNTTKGNLMACPRCGMVHIGGFLEGAVGDIESLAQDNTPARRVVMGDDDDDTVAHSPFIDVAEPVPAVRTDDDED